ncbi:hypothetical protein [Puia dinghuensis]|uniref:Uncharacterized protein n=1 Tax=Puia dinghuensis TaxID=1792502 RepID=A0A8J2UF21_9BACT|nr:hypothetical protein [Puia dinghuensis]GGB08808.1 hypothetical protein GCM10011511_35380 [Puia dinghuensis]
MKTKLFALGLIIASLLAVRPASAQTHVRVGIYERDYPGATYYTYRAWHGHDHDRPYYEHWHHRFEREHRGYFRGRQFDHERYESENHWHRR